MTNPTRPTFGRPTAYCGIEMRSRVEAGYAAWLETTNEITLERLIVGLHLGNADPGPWSYEPEVFASPDGQYLPDFAIMSVPLFVEVKAAGTGEASLLAAFRRMHIIHASLPAASLLVQVGTWSFEGYAFDHAYCCDGPAGLPRVGCPVCSGETS